MASPTSDTSWIAPVTPEIVWFSGGDAVRFLNDLISQEIGDLAPGAARRSFLLAPQGKLLFMIWVIRDGDRVGLMTEDGRGEELAQALSRYRIRVDVEIEAEEGESWIVMGEGAGFDVSWPGEERRLIIGQKPDLPIGSAEDYTSARVAAGEPAWGVEVDESTIPHSSGLVPASVDFTKGCFLGQELVARIDSRGGNVPERLMLIDSEAGDLAIGPILDSESDEAGRVTTVSGSVGLGLVKRSVEAGEKVTVGGVEAIVKSIPARSPG